MNASPPLRRGYRKSLATPRARIGMIIPSVDGMTDPNSIVSLRPDLMCMSRARVAGEWKRPLAMIAGIAASAKLLSMSPDLIVFHCTDLR